MVLYIFHRLIEEIMLQALLSMTTERSDGGGKQVETLKAGTASSVTQNPPGDFETKLDRIELFWGIVCGQFAICFVIYAILNTNRFTRKAFGIEETK
jgi:hypothetical protein